MKLILVVSLLLAWACIASWGDPVAIGVRLYSAITYVPEGQRSDAMKSFLTTVDQQTGSERRDKMRHVKVDTALAIGTNGAPVIASTESRDLKLRLVEETLRELQAACLLAGTPKSGTSPMNFEELQNLTPTKVKLPFVEQEVNSNTAVGVLALGMIGPFLYLISLMLAMRAAMDKAPSSEGAGWVFFHPQPLGFIVGTLWLCAPAIAVLGGACLSGIDRHFRLLCGFVLLVASLIPIGVARFLQIKFRKLTKK